jgi:hypothetical protein
VFLNMFSIAPHFYPIFLSKMLSSFHLLMWVIGEEFNVVKWDFFSSELMSQGRFFDRFFIRIMSFKSKPILWFWRIIMKNHGSRANIPSPS